jgi:1-acyl-sn-glycerol-3-phosphate acyltransferase
MLKILRLGLLGALMLVWFVFGLLICVLRPRHPTNVYWLFQPHDAQGLSVAGHQVKVTIPDSARGWARRLRGQPPDQLGHHSPDRRRTAGRGGRGQEELVWLPLFGILFYLSGNVLIDRSNRSRAIDTIRQVVDKIRSRRISIWMFPEGTRSRGRGLLPFKTGAFHTAMQAGVPIVPVVATSYAKQIDLNRWDNGEVHIEMLPPIDPNGWARDQVRNAPIMCAN